MKNKLVHHSVCYLVKSCTWDVSLNYDWVPVWNYVLFSAQNSILDLVRNCLINYEK